MEEIKSKSFWQILKGSLSGADQEGSAKRATAFYVVAVLITMIVVVYSIGFYMSINKMCSDEICKIIINLFSPTLWTLVLFVLVLLGLATMENITSLWKAIRGIKEDKPEEKK